MQSFVMTCDTHAQLIPGFLHQWDKYAGWEITTVYESKRAAITRAYATGAGEWSERLLRYLKSLSDDLVLMMLDDYYLSAAVNKSAYRVAIAKMETDENIQKIDLSGDRLTFPHHPMGAQYIAATLDADYLASTQAAIWRREFLVDILKADETIWQFEAHGTQRIRERGGAVILGQVKPCMRYTNVIERGDFTRWNDDGLTGNDVDELKARGMWGLNNAS